MKYIKAIKQFLRWYWHNLTGECPRRWREIRRAREENRLEDALRLIKELQALYF